MRETDKKRKTGREEWPVGRHSVWDKGGNDRDAGIVGRD